MRQTGDVVLITGIGVLAPNGKNKQEFWNSILKGVSGIKEITSFNTDHLTSKMAGIIDGFDPADYGVTPKESRRMARFSQLALCAAKMSVADAGLTPEICAQDNACISLGVGANGIEIIEKEMENFFTVGPEKVSPFTLPASLQSAAASNLAIAMGIKGRTITISTGCSSSLNAVGYAYELIRSGKIKLAICGGSEAPITPSIMSAFCAARSLSVRNDDPVHASRPFDRERDGYILSEGSAIFILESGEYARGRNAKVYGEIAGYDTTCDAYSMYRMDETGESAANAVKLALDDAGIKPSDVDYVNAHGSSSPVSDCRETKVLKDVFGDHAHKLKISSIKSMIGHALGAAGSIQLAATILSGSNGYITPTINYNKPDPLCDLDYVPNESIRKKINVALVNSFGMGGNNASVVARIF